MLVLSEPVIKFCFLTAPYIPHLAEMQCMHVSLSHGSSMHANMLPSNHHTTASHQWISHIQSTGSNVCIPVLAGKASAVLTCYLCLFLEPVTYQPANCLLALCPAHVRPSQQFPSNNDLEYNIAAY